MFGTAGRVRSRRDIPNQWRKSSSALGAIVECERRKTVVRVVDVGLVALVGLDGMVVVVDKMVVVEIFLGVGVAFELVGVADDDRVLFRLRGPATDGSPCALNRRPSVAGAWPRDDARWSSTDSWFVFVLGRRQGRRLVVVVGTENGGVVVVVGVASGYDPSMCASRRGTECAPGAIAIASVWVVVVWWWMRWCPTAGGATATRARAARTRAIASEAAAPGSGQTSGCACEWLVFEPPATGNTLEDDTAYYR